MRKILYNVSTQSKNVKNRCFRCNKGGEQPAAGAKKIGFPVFLHTVKGYTPPGGGEGLAGNWEISLGFRKFLGNKPYALP